MIPKPPRALPALFHRVFLSHLIVILLCFTAGLILVDYLFADGLIYYRIRSPLIVIPALLGLIGLSGLLALWTSGSIAVPLQRLSEALKQDAAASELLALRGRMGTEEGAQLAEEAAGILTRSELRRDSRPYTLVVDSHLNIITVDVDTAARLGSLPEEMIRLNLRDILTSDLSVSELLFWITSASPHASSRSLNLTMHSAANREISLRWHVLPLPGGIFLLTGAAPGA